MSSSEGKWIVLSGIVALTLVVTGYVLLKRHLEKELELATTCDDRDTTQTLTQAFNETGFAKIEGFTAQSVSNQTEVSYDNSLNFRRCRATISGNGRWVDVEYVLQGNKDGSYSLMLHVEP